MRKETYALKNMGNTISPACIYYLDLIKENTARAKAIAGGPEWLWPHVKSHKTAELIRLQMEMGVKRFKCATIAEAEMLLNEGAEHVLLAYPLVGPNIRRFLMLKRAYPNTTLYATGDDYEQLEQLSIGALALRLTVPFLLDVNMGMNRTGVAFGDVEELYVRLSKLAGLNMLGLHCYDGHHRIADARERDRRVVEADARVSDIQVSIRARGLNCGLLVLGGTPSFQSHTKKEGAYYSPGTVFLFDMDYYGIMQDDGFRPAAAVFTRVVSRPGKNLFTLDLGSKGIAADPPGARGVIVGLEHATPVAQSEEHWVFSVEEGEVPSIGEELYVIPTHICPTSALYPSILVAQEGEITQEWEVAARNRRIRY